MDNKKRVIFIGGLTNGKVVYDYLKSNKFVDLVFTVTYPDEVNKPRHITFPESDGIEKGLSANAYLERIKDLKPDIIFVAGWSELLVEDLINIPSEGTIGFHPSKLPKDRGRSVLAWQIEEGYTETALTMFYYNELPDCGDIIAVEPIPIRSNDYIDDILAKLDIVTLNLMRAYFPLIRTGHSLRKPQSLTEGNFRRLRGEIDSKIDWDTNSDTIYNKIRAISKPYPGACAVINGQDFRIWKAEVVKEFAWGNDLNAGKVVAKLYNDNLLVKTRDGFLKISDYESL